jgi:uncharacterized membrane protein
MSEPRENWSQGKQSWERGDVSSVRAAVSARREALSAGAAQRGEQGDNGRMNGRRTSRTEAARAERRRLDQPRDRARVRLPRYDPEVFGRLSEAIARGMGTARFLVYMTVVIVIWFAWNTLAPPKVQFDPYTFTFLTLILSLQASYAAPLILLAQNRQADRDRLALEEDRRRATMQKADTEYLAREIAALRIALGEVATRDFVRSELNRLIEDLGEAADRRSKIERKEQRRLARRAAEPSAPPSPPPSAPAAEPASATEEPPPDKKERRAPQGARRATPTT